MIKLSNTLLSSALAATFALLVSTTGFAADYPMAEKLQQCEAAFEKMHNSDLSKEETWKTRRDHKELVKEILTELNKSNHSILKSEDQSMSSDQILENFIVMGSLLEMMSAENLRLTDEFGYPLSD